MKRCSSSHLFFERQLCRFASAQAVCLSLMTTLDDAQAKRERERERSKTYSVFCTLCRCKACSALCWLLAGGFVRERNSLSSPDIPFKRSANNRFIGQRKSPVIKASATTWLSLSLLIRPGPLAYTYTGQRFCRTGHCFDQG